MRLIKINILFGSLIFFLFYPSIVAANNPALQFEKLVKESYIATNSFVEVFSTNEGWMKGIHFIDDLKYDVIKTNSLINPIIGKVDYMLYFPKSKGYPTKKEAEQSTITQHRPKASFRVALTYTYKDSRWHFLLCETELLPIFKGMIIKSTKEEILKESDTIPFEAIVPWVIK